MAPRWFGRFSPPQLVLAFMAGICTIYASKWYGTTREYVASDITAFRRNRALRDGDLLPFTICNSERRFLTFVDNSTAYRMVITAASAYNTSSPYIEVLGFYRTSAPEAGVCNHSLYGHCLLPQQLYPAVRCSIRGMSRPGHFAYPTAAYMHAFYGHALDYLVTVVCPLTPDESHAMATVDQHTRVKLTIAITDSEAVDIPLCYKYVPFVHELSVCTGAANTYSRTPGSFWHGSPPYSGDHSLMHEFLTFHVKIQGLHVTINDAYHEFADIVTPYLGRLVSYNPGWALEPLGPVGHPMLDHEVLVEATCAWQHRLDSKWVILLQGADNFLIPSIFGENVHDALKRLNSSQYSGAHVPTVNAFSRDPHAPTRTALERWNLLGRELEFGDIRHTPIVNPRHVSYQLVHWNTGRLPSFKDNLEYEQAFRTLGLHTAHMMALARPKLNRPEEGRVDEWYQELGRRLGRLM